MGEIRIRPTKNGQVIEHDGKTLADAFNVLGVVAREFEERLAEVPVPVEGMSEQDREAYDYLERFVQDLTEAIDTVEGYMMNTRSECDFYWKEAQT